MLIERETFTLIKELPLPCQRRTIGGGSIESGSAISLEDLWVQQIKGENRIPLWKYVGNLGQNRRNLFADASGNVLLEELKGNRCYYLIANPENPSSPFEMSLQQNIPAGYESKTWTLVEGQVDSELGIVCLRENFLGTAPIGMNNTTRHEVLGHRYEDAVKKLDRDYYLCFEKNLSTAFERAFKSRRFPTRRAMDGRNEFSAESLASHCSRHYKQRLEQADGEWFEITRAFIEHAAALL